jgi:hypothetical protein
MPVLAPQTREVTQQKLALNDNLGVILQIDNKGVNRETHAANGLMENGVSTTPDGGGASRGQQAGSDLRTDA